MKKRIFIGIKLSKAMQNQIADWQSKNTDLKVRFITPEIAHITLVPPWLEENIDDLKKKMEAFASELRPFSIYFNKITFGPTAQRPWLIWLEGKGEEYRNLAKKLRQHFGIESEYKEILPHITIARFKEGGFKKFPRKTLEEIINWPEEVKNITLFESLGESKYKILYDIAF